MGRLACRLPRSFRIASQASGLTIIPLAERWLRSNLVPLSLYKTCHP